MYDFVIYGIQKSFAGRMRPAGLCLDHADLCHADGKLPLADVVWRCWAVAFIVFRMTRLFSKRFSNPTQSNIRPVT